MHQIFKIRDIIEIICNYLSIEESIHFYLDIKMNPPYKSVQEVLDNLNKKFKNRSINVYECFDCNYLMGELDNKKCGICWKLFCIKCVKKCPNFNIRPDSRFYEYHKWPEACNGYICLNCISDNDQEKICTYCEKLCCCTNQYTRRCLVDRITETYMDGVRRSIQENEKKK